MPSEIKDKSWTAHQRGRRCLDRHAWRQAGRTGREGRQQRGSSAEGGRQEPPKGKQFLSAIRHVIAQGRRFPQVGANVAVLFPMRSTSPTSMDIKMYTIQRLSNTWINRRGLKVRTCSTRHLLRLRDMYQLTRVDMPADLALVYNVAMSLNMLR